MLNIISIIGGLFLIGIILLAASLFNASRKRKSGDAFCNRVLKYKVVEKYDDDPKWATYLYLDSGEEDWNQTIPGSFRAKHPQHDLTFVFETEEKARRYAEYNFTNAEDITKDKSLNI